MTVAADGQWVPTNVTARVGEPLVFRATGELTGAGDTQGPFDAFGEGGVGGAPYPLVNRPRFALFARVKQQVFLVGTATTALAPDSGPVELIVNARSTDAMQGAFSATVRAP